MADESKQTSYDVGGRSHSGRDPDDFWSEGWLLVIQPDPYRTWLEKRMTNPGGTKEEGPFPYVVGQRDPTVPEEVWQAAGARVQAYEEATWFAALPEESRTHFVEAFAYWLSSVVRDILSDKGLPDADKVRRVDEINLLLRDVLAAGMKMRFKELTWTQWDVAELIHRHAQGTLVRWAIERSRQTVKEISLGLRTTIFGVPRLPGLLDPEGRDRSS